MLSSLAPHERSIGEKLLIAVLILAAGDVAGKALGLIISIVRTRTLSTEEFGGLGFIVQTVGMFAQVAGFSLGMAATRYVAFHRSSEPRKVQEISQFILIIGATTTIVASLLMMIFAPRLASTVPGLSGPMRQSVLVLISQTMSGLVLGLLIGMERFRAATLATVLQNVVMLILTLWWSPLYGLTGAIYAMAVGFAITFGIAAWGSRDLFTGIPINLQKLWSHRSILWEFCLPSLLSGIILMPATWITVAIMAGQHGSEVELLVGLNIMPTSWPSWLIGVALSYHFATGLKELAIFFAADQLRPLLGLLTNVVSQPMMPIVTAQIRHAQDPNASDAEQENAKHKAQNAMFHSFQLVICLILPAHALLAFAGPYIMAIFGKTFASEWNVFLIVLAWGAFSGITSLMGFSLLAQGRMWLCNILVAMYGILLIIFCYILRHYGAIGLSLAYVLTSVISFGITSIVLIRSGLLSIQAVLLTLGSLIWLFIISLAAAWIPASWRIIAIPFSSLLTILMLIIVMRVQMLRVMRLVLSKVSSMIWKS